jgi:hypothetical protein
MGDPTEPDVCVVEARLTLEGAALVLDVAERRLRAAVTAARDAGLSWEDVGDALGTSKQAAWSRFAGPVDPGPVVVAPAS